MAKSKAETLTYVIERRQSPSSSCIEIAEMTTAETAAETLADIPNHQSLITINRRGYSWAILIPVWSDQPRAWFEERRVSSRRLTSGDVAEFLAASHIGLDDGAVEIKPFDHRRDVAVVLSYAQALDWFAGLADEDGAVSKTR